MKILSALLAVLYISLPSAVFATASSTTYSAPGNYTFTVPSGVNSITVETWGGGGTGGPATGNGSAGGGGAGGCYVSSTILNVVAGANYGVTVAATSTALTGTLVNGNNSTFGTTTIVANGGRGGAIASVATSTGGVGQSTGCTGATNVATSSQLSQLQQDNNVLNLDLDGLLAVGESFTPTTTLSFNRVAFTMERVGTPTSNLYVGIATSLNGAEVASSSIFASSSIPNTATVINFDFPSLFTATGASKYYLRIIPNGGSQDGVNFYHMYLWGAGDIYSNGEPLRTGADNVTWSTTLSTMDAYFSLQTATTTILTTIYAGGSGATSTASTLSGGGGGGAGSTGPGGAAAGSTAGTGTSLSGGSGGTGTGTSAQQNPGGNYGGGGAGGRASTNTDRAGGNGSAGLVVVSYNIVTPVPIAIKVSLSLKNGLFRLFKALFKIQN